MKTGKQVRANKFFWRDVWFEIVLFTALVIVISLLNFLIIWLKFGKIAPMTDADIAEFKRIALHYNLPFWSNIFFAWGWMIILYCMLVSKYVKKSLGRLKRLIIWTFVLISLCASVFWGGMLYGLVVLISLDISFIIVPIAFWLAGMIWDIIKQTLLSGVL